MLRCNLKAIPCYARDFMCGPYVGHVGLFECQALLLDRVDTFLVEGHAHETLWLSNYLVKGQRWLSNFFIASPSL